MATAAAPLLEVRGLCKRFGGLVALDRVSFQVREGEIRGLIGPNGAGKSTLFKNIAGFYRPGAGEILLAGRPISGRPPYEIAGLGVVRTFQETTLFQELSVMRNLEAGCHLHASSGLFRALLGLDRERLERQRQAAGRILDFVGLRERRAQLASELPLGSQRALALGIALLAKPRLLLLDEPFAGMNPAETAHMMELTRKVRRSGITIVLVEHNMKAVMGLCDFVTVLNFGRLLAEGTPESVRRDPAVLEAYLGSAAGGTERASC